MDDISSHNRRAWDHQVARGNRWTVPVTSEQIAAARRGEWTVLLTPRKPVPASWFPELAGRKVLALASGGGQQAPILAAAGASVTLLDNSPRQLAQDRMVAERDGLEIETVQGDMRDLSRFPEESFDLVFNPCSLLFVPDVLPVFEHVARVLRTGGTLMCGFVNPVRFLFDEQKLDRRELSVRHKLPYSDLTHLDADELQQLRDEGQPYMFSHSLEEMIAGQLKVGLAIKDLFDDSSDSEMISEYLPVFFATLASKVGHG